MVRTSQSTWAAAETAFEVQLSFTDGSRNAVVPFEAVKRSCTLMRLLDVGTGAACSLELPVSHIYIDCVEAWLASLNSLSADQSDPQRIQAADIQTVVRFLHVRSPIWMPWGRPADVSTLVKPPPQYVNRCTTADVES